MNTKGEKKITGESEGEDFEHNAEQLDVKSADQTSHSPELRFVPPTVEQQKYMDKRFRQLSDLFTGADFDWQLDGASNISFYEGRYIRNHKDVDVSVTDEDIPAIVAHLEAKEYGIYASIPEHKLDHSLQIFDKPEKRHQAYKVNVVDENGNVQKLAEWDEEERKQENEVAPKEKFARITGLEKLPGRWDQFGFSLFPLDEKTGAPDFRTNKEKLSDVDFHIHHQQENGDVEIYPGVNLPYEKYVSEKHQVGDVEIHTSQPILVAFHKLHQERPYDLIDMKYLMKHLSEEDREQLFDLLSQEEKHETERFYSNVEEVWEWLLSKPEYIVSEESIIRALQNQEMWQDYVVNPKISQFMKRIAEYLFAQFDMHQENPDAVREPFIDWLKKETQLDDRLSRYRQRFQSLIEAEKSKQKP